MLVLIIASPAAAQHLGARQQWQPEIADLDARLQQPVEIEIIGRAAVPALEILSEATGVSLSVAPEDLATVGERKFTIISKGLSLRAIMVQLPEALHECHWDIDPSGEQPVYFLHRDSGAEKTMDWLSDRAARETREEKREKLVDRMALARQALEMSAEELAELEKTDSLLARSVRDPHSRDLLEILLSLPPEEAAQFRDTGRLEIEYAQAPERLQKAIERIADMSHADANAVARWRDAPSHSFISFEDWHVDHGFGIRLCLNIPTPEGIWRGYNTGIQDVALFPRHFSLDDGGILVTRLLVDTGVPDRSAAFEMALQQDKEGFRADAAKREERHTREWIEPTDPALRQIIVIGDRQFSEFAEVQAFIAEETELPVVSDYFTLRGVYISEELREGVPLWRLLYVLGEDDVHGDAYLWQKVGDCLLFRRVDWYRLVKTEIPEAIIADYRTRVEAQGELTIDDLAALAVLLDSRDLPVSGFPRDLQRAGIHAASERSRWGLLLYASLSPEQQEKLRAPQGLSFDEMTLAQQRQVLDRAAERPVQLAGGAAYRATFHLVESVEDSRGRPFAKTEFQLRFPEVTDSAIVRARLLPAEEAAAATAAP
jgi:hypothetical protein